MQRNNAKDRHYGRVAAHIVARWASVNLIKYIGCDMKRGCTNVAEIIILRRADPPLLLAVFLHQSDQPPLRA
jgi:hypothetical protein